MADDDADDSANVDTLPKDGEKEGKAPEREAMEAKAKALGWSPKDEFKGNPDNWRDADEFLRRGEEILPIVVQNNRTLVQKVGTLEATVREQAEVLTELRDFARGADERAYKRARSEIQAEMRQAVNDADPAAHDRAIAKMDALESERPKASAPVKQNGSQPNVHPDVAQWVNENEWFNRDEDLKSYATSRHGTLLRDKPGLSLRENLDEVTRDVKARFPEKFGNPRREAPSSVSSPNGTVPKRKNGKSYDDLPAEAKKECDRFVKIIPDFTKEEFLKNYDWSGDQA